MHGGRVEGCGRYGVLVHNGGVVVAGESWVGGCWGDGVRVVTAGGSGAFRIPTLVGRGLQVANNRQCGVNVSGGGRAILQDAGSTANRRDGVAADGEGSQVLLRRCTLAQNGGGGVRVMSLARGRLEACTVLGSGGPGVRGSGQHTAVEVQGGSVRMSGTEGLLVDGGARMS
eukprot:2289998-Rhodomonas_salina.2